MKVNKTLLSTNSEPSIDYVYSNFIGFYSTLLLYWHDLYAPVAPQSSSELQINSTLASSPLPTAFMYPFFVDATSRGVVC